MMTWFLDVPGFLVDDEYQDDIVACVQEEYVDHVVSQMLVMVRRMVMLYIY